MELHVNLLSLLYFVGLSTPLTPDSIVKKMSPKIETWEHVSEIIGLELPVIKKLVFHHYVDDQPFNHLMHPDLKKNIAAFVYIFIKLDYLYSDLKTAR